MTASRQADKQGQFLWALLKGLTTHNLASWHTRLLQVELTETSGNLKQE